MLYPIALITGDRDLFPYALVGCTPLVASYSLMSYAQVAQLFDTICNPGRPSAFDLRLVGYGALVVLAYGLTATLLTWRTVRRFDRVIDRPRKADDIYPHKADDIYSRKADII